MYHCKLSPWCFTRGKTITTYLIILTLVITWSWWFPQKYHYLTNNPYKQTQNCSRDIGCRRHKFGKVTLFTPYMLIFFPMTHTSFYFFKLDMTPCSPHLHHIQIIFGVWCFESLQTFTFNFVVRAWLVVHNQCHRTMNKILLLKTTKLSII